MFHSLYLKKSTSIAVILNLCNTCSSIYTRRHTGSNYSLHACKFPNTLFQCNYYVEVLCYQYNYTDAYDYTCSKSTLYQEYMIEREYRT